MSAAPDVKIIAFGENGWIAHFGEIDNVLARALYTNATAKTLRTTPGILDAVAGVDSIVARFSPAALTSAAARKILQDAIGSTAFSSAPAPTKRIDIPVCYGGEHGPDFNDVCKQNNLTEQALIDLHTAGRYRVMAVGFAPGFAYMGPLDKKLTMPRLATPRAYLPAGSVGVAGGFTGVYSLPSPGGWRIIGRTPMMLFQADSAKPFIFEPGVEVRFTPVSTASFNAYEASQQ